MEEEASETHRQLDSFP
ncbi:hypothetical protein EYF80_066399 [Liparis tanakae]|uniref:Uncharacterized protein n=1 Tax=Liparis tanakae TaxID=230148 RepID=A0A4Z2E4I4_9TELE|nr:hypothetical protein EYF80_066399 [Liparis tanakae]